MSNKAVSVYAEALKRNQKEEHSVVTMTETKTAREPTRPLETSSEKPRDVSRAKPRDGLNRDAIQEFSFRLRDELKVKVQAEVPHGWQKELEEIARDLDVKKLELYRFIIGEFLGKVGRKPPT